MTINMTQEDKELLLKDLCSRLPYGIKALYYGTEEERETWDKIECITRDGYVDIGQYILPIERIKPYLFPMSSMTEKQEEEYNDLNSHELGWFPHTPEALNYLLKNHFDYMCLIDDGLAIDATGLNIY